MNHIVTENLLNKINEINQQVSTYVLSIFLINVTTYLIKNFIILQSFGFSYVFIVLVGIFLIIIKSSKLNVFSFSIITTITTVTTIIIITFNDSSINKICLTAISTIISLRIILGSYSTSSIEVNRIYRVFKSYMLIMFLLIAKYTVDNKFTLFTGIYSIILSSSILKNEFIEKYDNDDNNIYHININTDKFIKELCGNIMACYYLIIMFFG